MSQSEHLKRWGVPQESPGQPQAQPILEPQVTEGSGFPTLLHKEMMRFIKVGFQTVAAPVVTALLYLLIFAQILEGRVHVYDSVPYTSFLIPGLMMMSMLQNSFANPSSSLIQSRITGNLVFILLPPISRSEEHTSELQSRGQLVCRL